MLLAQLEHIPEVEAGKRLAIDYNCRDSSTQKVLVVRNQYEAPGATTDELWPAFAKFCNELVDGYLLPLLRKLRLFKECAITMPREFHYRLDDGIGQPIIMRGHSLPHHGVQFILDDSEIDAIEVFLRGTTLPEKDSFVGLAFHHFELSYETSHSNVSFILLMIALEVLLSPADKSELRYRISRNAAVLLGKSRDDARKIFGEVRHMYDKRSQLVHTGSGNLGTETDINPLREYVRRIIRKLNALTLSKDKLLDELNTLGFGEGLSE